LHELDGLVAGGGRPQRGDEGFGAAVPGVILRRRRQRDEPVGQWGGVPGLDVALGGVVAQQHHEDVFGWDFPAAVQIHVAELEPVDGDAFPILKRRGLGAAGVSGARRPRVTPTVERLAGAVPGQYSPGRDDTNAHRSLPLRCVVAAVGFYGALRGVEGLVDVLDLGLDRYVELADLFRHGVDLVEDRAGSGAYVRGLPQLVQAQTDEAEDGRGDQRFPRPQVLVLTQVRVEHDHGECRGEVTATQQHPGEIHTQAG